MDHKESLLLTPSGIAEHALAIDHIAIAVSDLEASIVLYRDVLGCELVERRTTYGSKTAMVSAVLKAGPILFVLVQGTSSESQVSRYIEHYGPGIQHVAISVRNLPGLVERLEEQGMNFVTDVIRGDGIRQIFTRRDSGSGVMFELIERQREDGRFSDESVQELFRQLEAADSY